MYMDARQPPMDIAGYNPVATAGDCTYDAEAAEKAVSFFYRCLTFIKGPKAGEPFHLEQWQADIVRTLFGWKRPDGTRRYRQCLIAVARKNGKSTWIAGLAAYVLFCDAEAGAECYCAASDREQASLVFNTAATMVRKAPSLAKRCKIRDSTRRIIYGNSFLRAIPANEGGSHGFDSHLIIGDELHAWPGREFHDVLHTSTGAREQPLEAYITTAGYDRESICFDKWEYARQVRSGKVDDDAFLPALYEVPETDDWQDEANWRKANPNLGVSLSLDYLRRECEKAKRDPAYENTFRRLHLNQWTSQEQRWIQMEHWRACAVTAEQIDREERTIGGLDLSAVADFTAWMMVQRIGETLRCRGHYFLPEAKALEYQRTDSLHIQQWVKDGWLTLIPGRKIEHSYIHARIRQDGEAYGVQSIGFDPWNMERLRQDLEGEGFEMIEVRQGYASLSSPSKEMERHILGHTLDHGGDPVLEWMADNAVCKIDENGNVRPTKASGKKKIDGLVALIIAIHAMQLEQKPQPTGFVGVA